MNIRIIGYEDDGVFKLKEVEDCCVCPYNNDGYSDLECKILGRWVGFTRDRISIPDDCPFPDPVSVTMAIWIKSRT